MSDTTNTIQNIKPMLKNVYPEKKKLPFKKLLKKLKEYSCAKAK